MITSWQRNTYWPFVRKIHRSSIKSWQHEHDDVIKWTHFPRYWPFVRGIHRSPVNSPHKGQWRGALMFSFVCVWMNGWINNRYAGDLRRYRTHYDVTLMIIPESEDVSDISYSDRLSKRNILTVHVSVFHVDRWRQHVLYRTRIL